MFLKRLNGGPKHARMKPVRRHWIAILEYLMLGQNFFEFGCILVPKTRPKVDLYEFFRLLETFVKANLLSAKQAQNKAI